MIAGVYNLTIEQGATFRRTLTVKDSAGLVVNLTGYTARMQIRPEIDSSTVMVSLTTANGGITLGGALGTIALYLSDTTTSSMQFEGVYDLELIQTSTGDVIRVLKGKVRLDPEVTRV
jgi:hypothetical protein